MSTNFPTNLDTGTSLVNNRSTGQTIPVSDHNDLANAAIALETKLGYGASTPSTIGQVLTVSASGQSAWQTASGGTVRTTVTVGYSSADYICTGASTGTTDDAQILAAINQVITAGGGKVFIKAGSYNITNRIVVLGSNLVIEGAGPGATVLTLANNVNQEIFVIGNGNVGDSGAGDGPTVIPTNNIFIGNMTLDGNYANQNAGSLYGASATRNLLRFRSDAQSSYYGQVYNIEARNGKQNGISFESFQFGTAYSCYCHGNQGFGIWWENGNNVNLTNNWTQNNQMAGMKVYSAGAGAITGNVSKGDYGAAFTFQGIGSTSITGNVAYRSGWSTGTTAAADGIALSGCDHLSITGNTIYGAYGNGLTINGSHYCTINGNVFRRNGQQTNATYSNINITNAGGGTNNSNNVIIGNTFQDDTATYYSNGVAYDISTNQVNAHLNNVIRDNVFGTGSDAPQTAPTYQLVNTSTSAAAGDNIIGQNVNLNPDKYYIIGSVSANTTVSYINGNRQSITLAASGLTLTLSTGLFNGQQLTLYVTQDATGSRTVGTWTNVTWSGGTAPTLATAANAINALSFTWNGSTWIGK